MYQEVELSRAATKTCKNQIVLYVFVRLCMLLSSTFTHHRGCEMLLVIFVFAIDLRTR